MIPQPALHNNIHEWDMFVRMGISFHTFFFLGIEWNIQICIESSCSPTPYPAWEWAQCKKKRFFSKESHDMSRPAQKSNLFQCTQPLLKGRLHGYFAQPLWHGPPSKKPWIGVAFGNREFEFCWNYHNEENALHQSRSMIELLCKGLFGDMITVLSTIVTQISITSTISILQFRLQLQ